MRNTDIKLQRYRVMEALGNVLTAATELCAAAHAVTAEPTPLPVPIRSREWLDRGRLSR
ncbi:MAG: hypothetical protein QNJ92_03975 [Alphaproteobacteria bacterium]|nr:hypothetical protein [Alphaproteobacteria bacterium]